MNNQLTISSVAHSFGRREIIDDINFTCRTGDVIGLFGRNGCGKSTLLKIIFGTLKPVSGVIYVNDQCLKQHTTQKLISYSHQEICLPQNITVRNVIPLYFSEGEDQNKIFYSPGINKIEPIKVGNLSIGEQRYLQFLLIIHLSHPFVLLDEPFSMVDPLYKEIIKEKIEELRAVKGFIITDHYYKDVLDIATIKILMETGKIKIMKDENDLKTGGYLPEFK